MALHGFGRIVICIFPLYLHILSVFLVKIQVKYDQNHVILYCSNLI